MIIKFQAVFIGVAPKVSGKGTKYFINKFNDDEGNILDVYADQEFPMKQYSKYDCVANLEKAFDKLNLKLRESKAIA